MLVGEGFVGRGESSLGRGIVAGVEIVEPGFDIAELAGEPGCAVGRAPDNYREGIRVMRCWVGPAGPLAVTTVEYSARSLPLES